MKKFYCDACGKEAGHLQVIGFPAHLIGGMPGVGGYVDSDGEQVSGRKDDVELCSACSNKAYSAALIELRAQGLDRVV